MTLTNRLQEFRFNLETMELLQSMGQSVEQISSEMSLLGFSQQLVTFCQSSRQLLNSVLLRLNIYTRQNMTEQQTRQGLSMLNNNGVSSLLDYLFESSNDTVEPVKATPVVEKVSSVKTTPKSVTPQPVEQPVLSQSVSQPVEQSVSQSEQPVEQSEQLDSDSEDEEDDAFETFFSKCIVQTEESSDILKTGDAYAAFQEWWESQYEEEVPDKKELKEFLNEKLGKCTKSKWTNVMLA